MAEMLSLKPEDEKSLHPEALKWFNTRRSEIQFEMGDLAADVCGSGALFILWALQRSGERGARIYRVLVGRKR